MSTSLGGTRARADALRLWGYIYLALCVNGHLPVSMKTHQELARHCEPSLTMRYTHPQLEDKIRALEALPPVKPTETDSDREAVA